MKERNAGSKGLLLKDLGRRLGGLRTMLGQEFEKIGMAMDTGSGWDGVYQQDVVSKDPSVSVKDPGTEGK